ncbi:hypothetical protein D3C85_1806450 [compost metagenome]
MKKLLSILLKVLAVLAIAIVVFLAIVFVVDKISSKSEEGKIKTYGQFVTVDGKKHECLDSRTRRRNSRATTRFGNRNTSTGF